MQQKTQIKTIKIPVGKEIFIYLIDNHYILSCSTVLDEKYLVLPKFISLSIIKRSLNFSYKLEDEKKFNVFFFNLNFWLKSVTRIYRQTLFLKGLGLKAYFSEDKTMLLLKLGYSHLFSISIPKKRILVKLNKNLVLIEGFDPVEVGNFANVIRCLKVPDAYKGKGIWYKREVKVLKQLKKK